MRFFKGWLWLGIVLLICLLVWLVMGNRTGADYRTSSHYGVNGFVNRYTTLNPKNFMKWQLERLRSLGQRKQEPAMQTVVPNLQLLHSHQHTTVTWVGHSTLLLQIDGLNILTDPIWSERASPISFAGPRRHQPPGLAFATLPAIDAVLISHNHYDHLDLPTVRALMRRAQGHTKFYVPLGVEAWFANYVDGTVLHGTKQNVFALDWDMRATLMGKTAPVNLDFLAVQHWSARTLWDRNQTLWGSWAVLSPQFRFWFSGDLGYSPDTKDIGNKYGHFDLAAIAIGAYLPRWFMKQAHVNPAEAVQVMQDVHAKQAIGIHWGTFSLADEPLNQAARDLQQAMAKEQLSPSQFFTLRPGETVVYRR